MELEEIYSNPWLLRAQSRWGSEHGTRLLSLPTRTGHWCAAIHCHSNSIRDAPISSSSFISITQLKIVSSYSLVNTVSSLCHGNAETEALALFKGVPIREIRTLRRNFFFSKIGDPSPPPKEEIPISGRYFSRLRQQVPSSCTPLHRRKS
jgi:hypothetical protein